MVAQQYNQVGLLPSFNINKKMPKDWSLNFKTEMRQSIYKSGEYEYEYLLSDLALAVGKKTKLNSNMAFGYLFRITETAIIHRVFQQFTLVKRYSNFRIAHRFASDQTFTGIEFDEFRLRYRLSSEIPLNGSSLDPKEFFLKLNNEYVYAIPAAHPDIELRLLSFLGYSASKDAKIELGLDYRLDSFIGEPSRQRLWFALNFYQSI